MNALSRLEEIEQQYDHLAQAGAYAEALDLITREAHLFPDYAQIDGITTLPKYGIVCQLDVYADLEHSFPADFESKLPDALDFVLQD